ncbi:apolipoprotein N-acyltransferase [Yoonia sp. BS5-3]|uniref:Apolipoprotein N-acyltransferase n=1 Tax=Yoonia phaeophyticola TaxID=3137369 RepID=A0ABZ2V461_9RHOB
MLTHVGSSGYVFAVTQRQPVPNIAAGLLARPAWQRCAVFLLLGGLAGLGQAPLDIWPATILALAILLYLHSKTTAPRPAVLHVWLFGIGYFAFSLRWIIEPFLVDIARHGWMAPFAICLMAAGAALFWAVAAWCACRVSLRNAPMLGLAIVIAEVTRSLILTGFPWALLGHVWISTGLAQLAAFGGPHLLSLISMIAAWALVSLAGRFRVIGIVTLGLLVTVSFVLRPGPADPVAADAPVVRIVQPNALQHQKWDPAYRDVFLNRLVTLTGQGATPDLVVWPETSVPYLLNYIEDDLSLFSEAVRGAPLVFGVQRADTERRFYNSLVVMDAGGRVQSIYDKQHLVPFGEYIPGAGLLGRVGAAGLARNLGSGFTSGDVPGPIDLPGIGAAIPLICYEGIFAEELTDGGDRARLLLLITNDAWFGQAAGPYQHLAQARLRAIEQGLPMVRAANTGISAMIDAKGRILSQLGLDRDGALDVALPPALPPTLYAQFGDWPFLAVLFLLTLGCYGLSRREGD